MINGITGGSNDSKHPPKYTDVVGEDDEEDDEREEDEERYGFRDVKLESARGSISEPALTEAEWAKGGYNSGPERRRRKARGRRSKARSWLIKGFTIILLFLSLGMLGLLLRGSPFTASMDHAMSSNTWNRLSSKFGIDFSNMPSLSEFGARCMAMKDSLFHKYLGCATLTTHSESGAPGMAARQAQIEEQDGRKRDFSASRYARRKNRSGTEPDNLDVDVLDTLVNRKDNADGNQNDIPLSNNNNNNDQIQFINNPPQDPPSSNSDSGSNPNPNPPNNDIPNLDALISQWLASQSQSSPPSPSPSPSSPTSTSNSDNAIKRDVDGYGNALPPTDANAALNAAMNAAHAQQEQLKATKDVVMSQSVKPIVPPTETVPRPTGTGTGELGPADAGRGDNVTGHS